MQNPPLNHCYRFYISIITSLYVITSLANAQQSEYRIGPGDTLAIVVWSDQRLSGSFVVSPDGSLALPPPVGTIQIRGLTSPEVEALLTERLSEIIRQPRVSVSILAFEGFRVHLVGPGIRLPAFYKVLEGTTLQEVITQGGGFTPNADRKHLVLKRRTEEDEASSAQSEERIIDYTQYLQHNVVEANPVLQVDDEIMVPILTDEAYQRESIRVFGAVTAPGIYPIEKPTRLSDILFRAGELTPGADLHRIQILEWTPEELLSQEVDFGRFLLESDLSANPYLSPGILVYIPHPIQPGESFPVIVGGQVTLPGTYLATRETRLMTMIFLAGGFAKEARLDDVKIIRVSDETVASTIQYSWGFERFC